MARDTHVVPFLRSPLHPYGAAHGQPIPPPGLFGTLEVTTKVLGGSNKPSGFTITVSGNSPSPGTFFRSFSGTIVCENMLEPIVFQHPGSQGTPLHTLRDARGRVPIKWTVTNQYIPTSAH